MATLWAMRLRHGATVGQAIQALDGIIQESLQTRNIGAQALNVKLNSYLNWVYGAQTRLRSIFADTKLEDSLLSRAYWHVSMASIPPSPELGRLVDEELIFQAGHPGVIGDRGGRLGEAADHLRALRRLADRAGSICVPDTNALLHYTRIDQLPWPERIGQPVVRLIVPLAVIDELDSKKYARREEFQQRARELLTLIDLYETATPDAHAQLREGVTFEVLPDESGHFRAASTDQEILERCEFLAQVTGSPVTLVTGDTGVRINARARGIEVIKLGEEDLLPRFRTPQQSNTTQSDEETNTT
jgi:rRNA-processing protein FCF1